MSIKIVIVCGLLLLGVAFGLWDSIGTPSLLVETSAHNNKSPVAIVPDIKFTSLDEKEYALHDFKGKTIIINFWATWCAPCIEEFPSLISLANAEEENLVLLAISVDENPENIQKFLGKLPDPVREMMKQDNIIIVHDKNKIISSDVFQTSTYPESFIIAPDLTINRKVIGSLDWMSDEMRRSLRALSEIKPDDP